MIPLLAGGGKGYFLTSARLPVGDVESGGG